MCCYDVPLPKRPATKDATKAARVMATLYGVKLASRASKGAALARAKRVSGTKATGGGMSPFNSS